MSYNDFFNNTGEHENNNSKTYDRPAGNAYTAGHYYEQNDYRQNAQGSFRPDMNGGAQNKSGWTYNSNYQYAQQNAAAASNNNSSAHKPKSNNGIIIFLSCMCGVLLLAVIALGIFSFNMANTIYSIESEYEDYYDYESLALFYLDNAVMVFDEDTAYYHRSDCPQTDSYEEYYIFNSENAKAHNYSACPVCFQDDAETYFDSYISTY